ncbi:MAG: PadR family transcriptional regulator [Candidatus Omnitrophica bacterium]|nr:PadR family transcriptional regulator [Candidatus Omnitrophota bacterium]
MTQDLVFLGLLKAGPKHGYEIKKTIQEELSTFANLDSQSIYYPLRRLEKKGLVKKRIGRKGKRPEKFIYTITKEGEKDFEKLLNDNFLSFQRPIFNLDLSLYFLPLVQSGLAESRLRSRLRGMAHIMRWLKSRKATLEKSEQPYHLLAIIEHQIELTKADIKFTQKLIKTLKTQI